MAKEAIDIKGTRHGLIILMDPNRNYDELKKSLIHKIESAQGFFTGAKFTLHPDIHLNASEKNQLVAICRQYGLIPTSNINWPLEKHPAPDQNLKSKTHIVGEQTLLVQKTLRSGHKVSYPGHVTVLGDVNPGAQVKAGGNVIIMGNCAGHIYAGTTSTRDVFVIALALHQGQINIAGEVLYVTPQQYSSTPIIAQLRPQGITIKPYLNLTYKGKG